MIKEFIELMKFGAEHDKGTLAFFIIAVLMFIFFTATGIIEVFYCER